ncbi:S24 family peptidase [Flavobacterium sp. SUN046]|uniref:LexA family transcriptional regulator n=1 Tax=Flavobacterium sp. SUN046 TaxID=3002440 RepID=UPI002DBEBC46|nr:S24 family peptidase [Flavobacterium sp. SUN046]MEC4049319.1 S24 family peptidase [Flavobacterium sp. SUN046]
MIEIQKDNKTEKFNAMIKNMTFKFPIAEISSMTGFSKGSISEIIKGKRAPSEAFLKKFIEAYKIEEKELFETIEKNDLEITGYYYPEITAAAGMDKEMQNDDLKRIPVTIPGWDKDVSFINVYGDSMYPKYNAGEIIGVKFIEFQYLNYGFPYVIVLNNGDTYIKIVQPGSDSDHLLLVSINEFYKPKEFHLSLIKSFYSIKGVIKKEMM